MQVFPQQEVKSGIEVVSDDTYTVIDKSMTILDEHGQPLAIYLRGELLHSPELMELGNSLQAYFCQRKYSSSTLRVQSSQGGTDKVCVFGKDKQHVSKQAKRVRSTTLGFAPKDSFNPCRKTVLTRQHQDFFNECTVPLLQHIDKLFQQHAPEQYRDLERFVETLNPLMRIEGTCITTATVNLDYQTWTHTDKGNYSCGLTGLAFFGGEGEWSGGDFLFPTYKLQIAVRPGDVLLANSQVIHCNNPIIGQGRISLVLYAAKRILQNCGDTTLSELNNPVFKRRNDKGKPDNGNLGQHIPKTRADKAGAEEKMNKAREAKARLVMQQRG
jgi:hypothetical protein